MLQDKQSRSVLVVNEDESPASIYPRQKSKRCDQVFQMYRGVSKGSGCNVDSNLPTAKRTEHRGDLQHDDGNPPTGRRGDGLELRQRDDADTLGGMMPNTVTREQLYEAVWKTPLNKLAATWDVTIASIVRACNTLNVPRPDVGHWQCVARGWEMEAAPLPTATPKSAGPVTLKPAGKRNLFAIQVKLSEDLRELHPLVRALYKRSKSMPAIDSGKVSADAACKAGVWVSMKHLRRAILILDAVVKGLEERGATFDEKDEPTCVFHAKLPSGSVLFRLSEDIKDTKELAKQTPVGGGFICEYEWRRKPLDKLTFEIPQRYPKGARKKWRDSQTYQIEDKISEIMEQILILPAWERESLETEDREREEANQRFWQEYKRRSAPDRLEKQTEELKKLVEEKQHEWVKARGAREFLAACEDTMRSGSSGLLEEWQRQWLQWGMEWVDSIDPLTNGFLGELKARFEKMRELERYVAQLKLEDSERTLKTAKPDATQS